MENYRFIFVESLKALGLIVLSLVAAKSVAGLDPLGARPRGGPVIRVPLYAAVLSLAVLGASAVGNDWVARTYYWRGQRSLDSSLVAQAYSSALAAVSLRPGVLQYWQLLGRTKFVDRQFESLLQDEPVVRSLGGGNLEEEDAARFAYCDYYLGHWDNVIVRTRKLIAENRYYLAAYVLQGETYTAEGSYGEAAKTFLDALAIYPQQQEAVEGLAHAYFLAGSTERALAVLDETGKFAFPPDARRRFDALRALYAQ